MRNRTSFCKRETRLLSRKATRRIFARTGGVMKRTYLVSALLSLVALGTGWAQDDNPPANTAPAPAYGQQNGPAPVSENPPLSALDQPGLEPHAAPESFLLMGLHFSESVDTNVGGQLNGSSVRSVTRGLGSLTLQRLWHNYDVALDYIGGAGYYSHRGTGLEQPQQLDAAPRSYLNGRRLAM